MEELIQQTQPALPTLQSKRLILNCFKSADAKETYASITPSLTRFMAWDPPQSEQGFATVWQNWLENMTDHKEYVFVIRHIETQEFIGLCGLHRLHDEIPEVGIWIRETAHPARQRRRPAAPGAWPRPADGEIRRSWRFSCGALNPDAGADRRIRATDLGKTARGFHLQSAPPAMITE